jgi:hypothetical protein
MPRSYRTGRDSVRRGLAFALPSLLALTALRCVQDFFLSPKSSLRPGFAVWKGGAAPDPHDWSNPANWLPSSVPSSTDTVIIVARPNEPILSANAAVGSLTLGINTTLRANGFTLVVLGDLDAAAGIGITGQGLIILTGTGKTLRGVVPNLQIVGGIILSGSATVTGDLIVESGAKLTLRGNTLSDSGNANVGGTLVMSNTADLLLVHKNLVFSGSRNDTLIDGRIAVEGNFAETCSAPSTCTGSFVTGGQHTLSFNSVKVPQTISFDQHSAWHFNNIDFSAGADSVTFLTDAVIEGSFVITGDNTVRSSANATVYVCKFPTLTNAADWMVRHTRVFCPKWTQLTVSGVAPAARWQNSAVYDPNSNRMIVFGGADLSGTVFGDVWALDYANGIGGVSSWTQLSPLQIPPGARTEHTAVYDPVSNRMIVFGWSDDSVWILANANGMGGVPSWSQLITGGTPPPTRWFHTTVYDEASNRMIVFAGIHDTTTLNDVWVLTNANGTGAGGSTWLQLAASGSPPSPRSQHTAVFDSSSNRMIVFGGGNQSGSLLSDVWVLTNADGASGTPTWIELNPTGGPPPARWNHSAVFDPASDQMIVLGGHNSAGTTFSDVWILTSANGVGAPVWSQLNIGNSPAITGTRAVYDPTSSIIALFGGHDGNALVNNSWVLAGANNPSGQPQSFAKTHR